MIYRLITASFLIMCILMQAYMPISSKAITLDIQSTLKYQSTVSCTGGQPSCSDGLVPACPSDTTFTPTCLPGFTSFIECCKSDGVSLNCNSLVSPACISSSLSSSGVVSTASSAFCSNDTVLCTSGGVPSCNNLAFDLTCLPGSPKTFPDCCRDDGFSRICDMSLLQCTLEEAVDSTDFLPIDINVLAGPTFPDVVELPLVTNNLSGKVGFAYPGSVSSFEIKLPEGDEEFEVLSVDLKDNTGFIFRKIPFTLTAVSGNPEKKILTLELPKSIATGEATFALKFDEGVDKASNGLIFITDALTVFKEKKTVTKQIFKPVINRVSLKRSSKNKRKYTLQIKGKEFLGNSHFVERNGTSEFITNTSGAPNTLVSIFPSTLDVKITKRTVSKSGKSLKVKLEVGEPINETIKAIVSVSTAAGTDSSLFKIKGKNKDRVTFTNSLEVSCFMGKPICENGKAAKCTNSAYSPVCLPSDPKKIPDCCKIQKRDFEASFVEQEERNLKCELKFLTCPIIE